MNRTNKSINHSLKYRSDIDGLRALAVLGVVIFHAFPQIIRGGFVGVDIFFVISGFLISTIIFNGLENDTFSFATFYSRRIKRIFPALILVLITTFLLGWFSLLSDEYKQLGKHITAGSFFFSNITLWQEVGYFDNHAESKPLLHLWSLGIEEQFYLIYPFLLWISWKSKFNLLLITVLIAGISFYLNLIWVRTHPALTFYLPVTRLWELLSGSILAYLILHKQKTKLSNLTTNNLDKIIISNKKIPKFENKTRSNIISTLGFLLLLYSFLRINKSLYFPGKWAIFPVLGSILIILGGMKAWINQKILSNKIIIWFGLISYPLYLWHWPLLTFARISEGGILSTPVLIVIIIVAILLSWITHKFVEKKIQFNVNNKITLIVLISITGLLGSVGYLTFSNNGFKSRDVVQKNLDENQDVLLESNQKEECEKIKFLNHKFCEKYNTKNSVKKILLWGDSSVKAWLPIFADIAKKKNYSLISISHPSCPPLLKTRKTTFLFPESYSYCSNGLMQNEVLKYISSANPDLIVMIAGWNFYSPYTNREFITDSDRGEADEVSTLHSIEYQVPQTLNELSKLGKLVVFKSWPILPKAPNYRIKRIEFFQSAINNDYNNVYISIKDFERESDHINDVFSKINNTKIFFYDPSSKICKKTKCDLTINSKHLYSDSYHITKQGSSEFRSDIEKILSM